jgi:putative aldouronate transport system substrate-binding protein
VRYQYRSSLPLKGPKGLQGAAYFPATASIAYMISANCKNPEAAFRLGDAMLDREICIISRHGERGVNWDYIKDVKNPEQYSARIPGWPISIVKYKPDWWSGSTVYNSGWRQAGAMVLDFGVINGWGMSAEDLATEGTDTESVLIYQNGGFKPGEFIPKFIYSRDENGEIREISANLLTYLTEMTSSFLTGRRDIDSSWNTYLTELDKIDLKRFIQINQEAHNRYK